MAEKWLIMTEKMTNPDLIDYLIIDNAIPSIIIVNYCTKSILATLLKLLVRFWPAWIMNQQFLSYFRL